ncbi:MAG TPA: hypothetical protein VF390_03360, partial [Patescibacteria group bacterium]
DWTAGGRAFSNGLHTQTVSPTSTQTYSLDCWNARGGTTQQATVIVNAAPVITPTLTFSASPGTITSGNSSTLSWNVQNADGCWGYDGDWVAGNRAVSNGLHTQVVSPTSTQTYSLDCWHNGGGSITAYTTVNVNPVSSPTVTLTASPNPTAAPNSPTTLTWTTNNATSCTASGAWNGARAFTNGPHSQLLSPGPASTTTYSIECWNGAVSSGMQSVTVTVNCVPTLSYTCIHAGTSCNMPADCGLTLTENAICTRRTSCTGALTSAPLSNCSSCADIPVTCAACPVKSGNWKEVAP